MIRISKRFLRTVQTIACVAVTVIMMILALTPLARLNLQPYAGIQSSMGDFLDAAYEQQLAAHPENEEELTKQFDAYWEKLDAASKMTGSDNDALAALAEEEEVDEGSIAEMLSVSYQGYDYSPSPFGFLTSFPGAIKVIIASIRIQKINSESTSMDAKLEALQKLEETDFSFVSQDAIDTAYFLQWNVYRAATSNLNAMDTSQSGNAFASLLTMVYAFAILIIALVVCPIVFIVCGILAIISLLVHIRVPQDVYGPSCNKFLKCAMMLPVYFILPLFYSNSTISGSVTTMIVLSVILIAINLVVTRIQKHSKEEFMYLNILQGGSVLGIIGVIMFACTVGNADLAGFFNSSDVYNQLALSGSYKSLAEVKAAQAIVSMTATILQIFYLFVYTYAIKMLARAACMDGNTKKATPDAHIVSAIVGMFSFILPFIMCSVFKLTMPSDLKGAVITYGIGTIIMLIAEIAVYVLKPNLAKGLTEESARAVKNGGGSAVYDGLVFGPVAELKAVPASAEVAATDADEESNKTDVKKG
ncbi:MAG: hypothetical protein ACI4NG_04015 [Candidatus Gallimonas sp.]